MEKLLLLFCIINCSFMVSQAETAEGYSLATEIILNKIFSLLNGNNSTVPPIIGTKTQINSTKTTLFKTYFNQKNKITNLTSQALACVKSVLEANKIVSILSFCVDDNIKFVFPIERTFLNRISTEDFERGLNFNGVQCLAKTPEVRSICFDLAKREAEVMGELLIQNFEIEFNNVIKEFEGIQLRLQDCIGRWLPLVQQNLDIATGSTCPKLKIFD